MAKKRTSKARSSSIEPLHALVGCVRDRRISDKVGVSVPAVSRYRGKHSIESFNQNIKDVQAVLDGQSPGLSPAELQKKVHERREALADPSRSNKRLPLGLAKGVLGLLGLDAAELSKAPSKIGKEIGVATEVVEDLLSSYPLSQAGTGAGALSPKSFPQAALKPKKAFLLRARENGEEHAHYALASSLSEAAVVAEEAQAQGLIKGRLFEIREVGDAVG